MKNKYYSVSRILNKTAVLEFPNREFHEIDLELLPPNIKEGNILIKNEKNNFVFDYEEEIRRKKEYLQLQNDIFK